MRNMLASHRFGACYTLMNCFPATRLAGANLRTVAEVAAEVYEACRGTRRVGGTRGDVRLFVLQHETSLELFYRCQCQPLRQNLKAQPNKRGLLYQVTTFQLNTAVLIAFRLTIKWEKHYSLTLDW